MEANRFTKEQCHELVTATKNIALHYNETGFLNDSPALLKAWQITLQDSHKVHKYLFKVSGGNDAAWMGLRYVVMMLLRLSHLIHNGREESDEDRSESYQRFIDNYGRRPGLNDLKRGTSYDSE